MAKLILDALGDEGADTGPDLRRNALALPPLLDSVPQSHTDALPSGGILERNGRSPMDTQHSQPQRTGGVMSAPTRDEQLAARFGCTAEQIRAQFGKNADVLGRMAVKAEASAKQVNGYSAEQLRDMEAKARARQPQDESKPVSVRPFGASPVMGLGIAASVRLAVEAQEEGDRWRAWWTTYCFNQFIPGSAVAFRGYRSQQADERLMRGLVRAGAFEPALSFHDHRDFGGNLKQDPYAIPPVYLDDDGLRRGRI